MGASGSKVGVERILGTSFFVQFQIIRIFQIQYRTPQNPTWLPANDFPIGATRFEGLHFSNFRALNCFCLVVNLRDGDFEFRVFARYETGRLSDPSLSTGFVRVNGKTNLYNPDISRPGKPQVIASDTSWIRLRWQPSTSLDKRPLAYLVEVRETSDQTWFLVGEPIATNEFIGVFFIVIGKHSYFQPTTYNLMLVTNFGLAPCPSTEHNQCLL